jgi:translation initiation factor IF-3
VNAIATNDTTRINDRIRAPRLRLVSVDGSQLGIFNTEDALKIADEEGLDLVEVAPNADPPVARVMDYSKWKYEEDIKAKKARKNQTTIQVKEIKFRPKIDVHDYETKKKHVIRFIDAGAKVKVTIMFRGREMVHAERGLAILERLAEDIREIAHVENQPKLEGRNMFMLISPSKKDIKPAAKSAVAKDGSADVAEAEIEPAESEAAEVEAPSVEVEAPAVEVAPAEPSVEVAPAAPKAAKAPAKPKVAKAAEPEAESEPKPEAAE